MSRCTAREETEEAMEARAAMAAVVQAVEPVAVAMVVAATGEVAMEEAAANFGTKRK